MVGALGRPPRRPTNGMPGIRNHGYGQLLSATTVMLTTCPTLPGGCCDCCLCSRPAETGPATRWPSVWRSAPGRCAATWTGYATWVARCDGQGAPRSSDGRARLRTRPARVDGRAQAPSAGPSTVIPTAAFPRTARETTESGRFVGFAGGRSCRPVADRVRPDWCGRAACAPPRGVLMGLMPAGVRARGARSPAPRMPGSGRDLSSAVAAGQTGGAQSSKVMPAARSLSQASFLARPR